MRGLLSLIAVLPVLLALSGPAGGASSQEDLKQAARALAKTDLGDAPGFAQASRPLLAAGEKALPVIKAELRGLEGIPAFQLSRARDMIHWPLNVRGALACRVVGPFWKERGGLEPGMIVHSLNGRDVGSEAEYLKANHELHGEGKRSATFEVLQEGVRKTVKHPGFNTGLTWRDYPIPLTWYLHEGHRSPEWDALAKEGLTKSAYEWTASAADSLTEALKKGCRDPLVLSVAIERYRRAGEPEKALGLWQTWNGNVRAEAYDGLWTRQAMVEAGRAAHETDDSDRATGLLEEAIRQSEDAGDPATARTAKLARALVVRDTDPEEALRIFESVIGASRDVEREWVECMIQLLKTHGRTERLDKWKFIYDAYNVKKKYAKISALDLVAKSGRAHQFLIPKRFMFSSEETAARGRADGFKGEYFPTVDFKGTPVVRVDSNLDFHWFYNAPLPGFPADGFSVRWTGKLLAPHSDTYSFEARGNDHLRVWIDGSLVVDAWTGKKKQQRYFGSIYLKEGKKYDFKLEYYHARRVAHVSLRWTCPSMARAASPSGRAAPYWALVFRNNYDVGEMARFATGRYRPPGHIEAGDGTLLVRASGRMAEVFSWEQFGPEVRVEVDAHLRSYPDRQPAYFRREVSVNGLLHEKHQWEIGTAFEFPRRFQAHLFQRGRGFGYTLPWLDGRKKHRLAVESYAGAVEHRIDGRKVDTQPLPGGWIGRAGMRVADGTAEFDNFEIYVPSKSPVDNEAIRKLYDDAARAYLGGDLEGCLSGLEKAASLQPRVLELGRHYAGYVVLRHPSREAAFRVLDRRFGKASHPKTLEMLIAAERAVDLFFLDDVLRFDELKITHLSNLNKRVPKLYAPHPVDLRNLKEKGTLSTLSVYADHLEALHGSKRRSIEEVEEALRDMVARHPSRIGPRVWLVRFLLDRGKRDLAKPLLLELAKKIPEKALPTLKD